MTNKCKTPYSSFHFVFVLHLSFGPYRAISWVDGLVGLSSLCIDKLSINEQLMRHPYGHVVDVFLHLKNKATVNVFFIF